MKYILPVIFCTLLFASSAYAHVGGFTYEEGVDNYFVDIGASKLTLIPGELTLFEYNLFAKSDQNNLADFDTVYVTISDDKSVQVSTYVHRPIGSLTVMSYSFPHAGEYEMTARFQKTGETLAEVSFTVPVQITGINPNYVKVGIAALLVGLFTGFGVSRLIKSSRLTQ